MALIVQKYGGTSVADPDRIRAVAEHVAFTKRHGNDVVVVVSAMGKSTDNLIKLANDVSGVQPSRELDMLLSTGERISMTLVCMALAGVGIDAISFTGSQVGIITDTVHTKAKILEIKGDRVREALAQGKVCVVAGFQGVSTEKEITTLGRGGSDTTAVALAAALGADSCEIYTDVTGVFSADPRIVPQARKLQSINFEEMLEMAGAGSKVLALRSVEFARNHNVPIQVRSSFTWEPGTWITSQEPSMEDPIISSVVTDVSEAKVTVQPVAEIVAIQRIGMAPFSMQGLFDQLGNGGFARARQAGEPQHQWLLMIESSARMLVNQELLGMDIGGAPQGEVHHTSARGAVGKAVNQDERPGRAIFNIGIKRDAGRER